MAAKPATASGVIVASHPPARKTSASPHLIARQASPTELLAVAHAVTKEILGPRKLSSIETRALAAFPIMHGDCERGDARGSLLNETAGSSLHAFAGRRFLSR